MNKLIATIALAALAFTSCIKENDTWKEMLPVQPGMYIYQLATDQDKLAMRPANAALRLAMLLAEADKQGEDVLSADLKEIVVKKGDARSRSGKPFSARIRNSNGRVKTI